MNPNKKRREISSNISCLNMAHKTPDHGQKILIPRFKFNRSTESPVQWVRFLPISSNLALNSVSWLKIYKSRAENKMFILGKHFAFQIHFQLRNCCILLLGKHFTTSLDNNFGLLDNPLVELPPVVAIYFISFSFLDDVVVWTPSIPR